MKDTKQEILDATFHLFAEKGYHTSMSDISKKVGIKVPSIYSHFKSKDEIIYIVMEREIKYFFEKIRSDIKMICKNEMDCGNRLRKTFISVLTYYNNYEKLKSLRNISLICKEELRIKCRELFIQEEAQTDKLLINIFEEGVRLKQIKSESSYNQLLFYITMLQGILELLLIYHGSTKDLELYKDKIWLMYWESIKS